MFSGDKILQKTKIMNDMSQRLKMVKQHDSVAIIHLNRRYGNKTM